MGGECVAEILASFKAHTIESRYCGVLKLVRVLPNLADNMIQARESSKQIEVRLNHVLARPGPLGNALRTIHQEINQSIPDVQSNVKESEDMVDGGLGILTLLCKQVRGKIEEIAEKGPKYKELIRMENYHFLQKTLLPRGLTLLNPFINDWQKEFKKVRDWRWLTCRRRRFTAKEPFVINSLNLWIL